MSSQPDKPSNPPPDSPSLRSAAPEKNESLMATLSEASASKFSSSARAELNKVLEEKITENVLKASSTEKNGTRDEVTEAAVKFTDGVDVITETLILILGKFKSIIWRTNVGMTFGGFMLITCLLVARQTQRTALLQQESAKKVADLTAKLQEALSRLDKIQDSATSTEKKVDAVKETAENKPSIEIVPDKERPGSAKVVIRRTREIAHPTPSAKVAPSGEPAPLVEFPLPTPKR